MPSNQYLAIANPAQGIPILPLQVTGSPEIALEIYRANVDMLLHVNQEYSGYIGSYSEGGFLSQLYASLAKWNQYDGYSPTQISLCTRFVGQSQRS